MAVLDYYVDTAVAASGDGSSWTAAYKTLAAALTALAQNLVTAGNSLVIHCRASAGGADTTAPSFSATWVTDATHYLTIQVDAADRHAGIWDTTKYRLQGGFYPVFSAIPAYTRFIGLQALCTADDVNTSIWRNTNRIAGVQITSCISRWSNKNYTYGSQIMADVGVDMGGDPWVIRNCVYYGGVGTHGRSGSMGVYAVNSYTVVEGCTLIGGATNDATGIGVSDGYSRVRATDVLCKGWASFGNPNAAGTDYNAGDTASVPGVHSRSTQTFSFVDAANDKYQLASTDTGAKGFGTDLSADASWPFSDDVSGAARTTPWDIGAFKAAAPSGVSGSALGTITFTGSASGVVLDTASATGPLAFAGSASANQLETAAASGVLAFAGSASGVVLDTAVATAPLVFTGSASASQLETAQATGTLLFGGTALAQLGAVETAQATGTINFTGSATGTVRVAGQGAGTVNFSGSATATESGPVATAAGTLSFTGNATGAIGVSASAAGTVSFAGGASAVSLDTVSATAAIAFGGSAAATQVNTGTASGVLAFGGNAQVILGTTDAAAATGTITFGGSATAISAMSAQATGVLVFGGNAQVIHPATAVASGSLSFSGNAGATVLDQAAATGPIAFSGAAAAVQLATAQATGVLVFGGNARAADAGAQNVLSTLALASRTRSTLTLTANLDSTLTLEPLTTPTLALEPA